MARRTQQESELWLLGLSPDFFSSALTPAKRWVNSHRQSVLSGPLLGAVLEGIADEKKHVCNALAYTLSSKFMARIQIPKSSISKTEEAFFSQGDKSDCVF
jgi:hypothetical protein